MVEGTCSRGMRELLEKVSGREGVSIPEKSLDISKKLCMQVSISSKTSWLRGPVVIEGGLSTLCRNP